VSGERSDRIKWKHLQTALFSTWENKRIREGGKKKEVEDL